MYFKNLLKKIFNFIKNWRHKIKIIDFILLKLFFCFFVSKKIVNKKTLSKKNLIVLNSQDSIGDQIVFMDFLSRLDKLNLNKNEKWFILYPNSFKELLNIYPLNNLKLIFIKNSLGSHALYRSKSFIRNFFKILLLKREIKNKKIEFDNVLFPGRLMEINNLTIASNIKCNTIYKFLDCPDGKENDKEAIEQISNLFYPFNSLNELYSNLLKNKTKLYEASENIHYSKNIWDFFCSFEQDMQKVVKYNNCYEFIWKFLLTKNKNITKKNHLNILVCVNREIYKVFLLDSYIYILNMLSKKINVFVNFTGIFPNKKIVKNKTSLIENNCHFPYQNLIQKTKIKDLFELVSKSDVILTEDTWLCHMGNMLMKNTFVFVNKDSSRYVHTINYWNDYKVDNKLTHHTYKVFPLTNDFFYPKKNHDLNQIFLYLLNSVIPFITKTLK